MSDNATVTIYYYNELAFHDQIENLVQIIGQDNLIEKVANKSITFIKQSSNETKNENKKELLLAH